jgi:hypothetical protein
MIIAKASFMVILGIMEDAIGNLALQSVTETVHELDWLM